MVEIGTENGQPPADRSGAFHKVVLCLHDRGFTAAAIMTLLGQHPGGIAKKFDGRLAKGIAYSFDKGQRRAQSLEGDAADGAGVNKTQVSGPSSSADAGPGSLDAPRQNGSAWPFRLVDHGVERLIERTDPKSGATTRDWKWFCSRLEVAAYTRDADSDEWGRLLLITDRDGRQKQWAMPMSMLAGDGVA